MELFTSLSGFIEVHVNPHLKVVFEDEPEQSLALLGVDPAETIKTAVEGMTRYQWEARELNLPEHFEDMDLEQVEYVDSYQVNEVRELSSGRAILDGNAVLTCYFSAFMHKQYTHESLEFTVYEPDWNNYYAYGSVTAEVKCGFRLDIDLTNPKKPDVSVLSLDIHDP